MNPAVRAPSSFLARLLQLGELTIDIPGVTTGGSSRSERDGIVNAPTPRAVLACLVTGALVLSACTTNRIYVSDEGGSSSKSSADDDDDSDLDAGRKDARGDDDDAGRVHPPTNTLGGVKLDAFRANGTKLESLSISELTPNDVKKGDKVLLHLAATWDPYGMKFISQSEFSKIPDVRSVIVVVVEGGQAGRGDGALYTDFTYMHERFPEANVVFDRYLAILRSVSSLPEPTTFPSFVGLDAVTFDVIGQTSGFASMEALSETVATWASK